MDWIDVQKSLEFIEEELETLNQNYGLSEKDLRKYLDEDTQTHIVDFYKKKKQDFSEDDKTRESLTSPYVCPCHHEEWHPLFDDHLIIDRDVSKEWKSKIRSLNGFIHACVGSKYPINAYEFMQEYGPEEMLSSLYLTKLKKEKIVSLNSYRNSVKAKESNLSSLIPT